MDPRKENKDAPELSKLEADAIHAANNAKTAELLYRDLDLPVVDPAVAGIYGEPTV